MRWETWAAATVGAALTAIAVLLFRPDVQQPATLALALHETRDIDVLISSERELQDATIQIVASGSIVLAGLDDERRIELKTTLEPGSNLLTLPVSAQSAGTGRLLAAIEHAGRTRHVFVNVTVQPAVGRT